jgi:hypothetical protein
MIPPCKCVETHPGAASAGRSLLGPRFRFTAPNLSDYAAGAVAINRHNLDVLCDDDCGGVGSLVMTRPNPVRRGKSRPVASARRVGALLILRLRLKQFVNDYLYPLLLLKLLFLPSQDKL